jgi:spore germination protein GerM
MKFSKLVIPVLLILIFSTVIFGQKNEETMTIKVYFGDSINNPNIEDCGKVRAVTRTIPKTKGVARAALNELFKGPTAAEEADGLYSLFSEKSKSILKGIKVKDGAAYVNFDAWVVQNLGTATASCGGESFLSQIETTLKQFPTIKKVFYAIEKSPEEFYSWMQFGVCPEELNGCCNENF